MQIARVVWAMYIVDFLVGAPWRYHSIVNRSEAEMDSVQPVEPDQVETCGGNKVSAAFASYLFSSLASAQFTEAQ